MDFKLLKRTYPTSEHRRYCDGHEFVLKNSTEEERLGWGVEIKNLQKFIEKGEKYIYQVAMEGKEFKTLYLSFSNYEIIRKFILKGDDE